MSVKVDSTDCFILVAKHKAGSAEEWPAQPVNHIRRLLLLENIGRNCMSAKNKHVFHVNCSLPGPANPRNVAQSTFIVRESLLKK